MDVDTCTRGRKDGREDDVLSLRGGGQFPIRMEDTGSKVGWGKRDSGTGWFFVVGEMR